MHKQSFAEYHSLATKPHGIAHPCISRLKFPGFKKESLEFSVEAYSN